MRKVFNLFKHVKVTPNGGCKTDPFYTPTLIRLEGGDGP